MEEKLFNFLYYFEISINAIFYILNIGTSIFVCFEWRKTKSIFKSPYFYFLNFFYIWSLIFNVAWVYVRHIDYDNKNPFLPLLIFIQWYQQCIQGILEFVLGLTRCTALAFPTLHTMLWEKKRWIFFMILIATFPFTSHGYVFARFDCKFQSFISDECYQFRSNSIFVITYMTLGFNVACLSVIAIGLIFSPKSFHKTQKSIMERRLTLQVSIYCVANILLYAESFIQSYEDMLEYKLTSYLFWMLQYYPSMCITFFLTPTVRTEFAAFYLGIVKNVVSVGSSTGTSVTMF